ncbi:hypothetical protein H5410_031777 [Solanum commersonii]|uniref:Uncharacterized protein n=1 Tax=Solanum commersonii TaxID=4109 RepID=A0A9J5YKY5_SOLCO|nr:hypothetical protein H5410_031777 [Solanum commersonii]
MGATLLVSLPVLKILSALNSVSCFMLNEYLNLMKGVGSNLAITFSVYDTVRSPDDSTVLVSIACGSLSGVVSSTVLDVEDDQLMKLRSSHLCDEYMLL